VDELISRLDVILRADMVEKAKAGDKCTFTGTFIVVPDVSQLGLPGVNKEMMRENNTGRGDGGVASQGVTGLKALGVRDLQYKTAFLACHVRSADSKVSLPLAYRIYADGRLVRLMFEVMRKMGLRIRIRSCNL